MGDATSRRNQMRNRLRAQLRKKRESLADQFDFKIYIAFVFKEKVCFVKAKPILSYLSIPNGLIGKIWCDSIHSLACGH